MSTELAQKGVTDPDDKQILLSFFDAAYRKEGGKLETVTGGKFTMAQVANAIFALKPEARHGVIDHFTKLIEAHAPIMPYIKYVALVLLTPKK